MLEIKLAQHPSTLRSASSLPARHLAHALLNVIIHASAETENLLQFGPVEDKVRCDQYRAEEQVLAILLPSLPETCFTVLGERSACPSTSDLQAVDR
jgi:hypothetical protein